MNLSNLIPPVPSSAKSPRIFNPAPITKKRFHSVVLLALLFCAGSVLAENPWDSSPFGRSSWGGPAWGSFSPGLSVDSWAPAVVIDPNIDPVMLKAGNIAEGRALSRSSAFCWRYVKEALVKAGSVRSYPQTAYARDAGRDLVQNHGFVRLAARSASHAPIGSVLVYGGRGAGHVELRTARGFVSDYRSPWPCSLPFLGAFARVDRHRGQQTAQTGRVGNPGS